MEITTRPITEDESVEFREAIARGFGDDLNDEEFPPEWFTDLVPLGRTVAAFDGEQIVGTLGGFPFEITVPGGTQIPMAGATIATVAGTHRRRGVLTAMMRDHLDDGRSRGEPLVGLWSSESVIYGRFGFGVASEHEEIEMNQSRISVSGDAGSVRLVSREQAAEAFPDLYDEERLRRPGMLGRAEKWWEREVFFDPSARREGFSAQRYLLHETDGRPDGYAIYRQKGDWSDGFPNGAVKVREVVTLSTAAHTGTWRFLTTIDLFPRISFWNLPVDDPLRLKVPDHRRIIRKRWDSLYVRILDVAQALEARTYAADGVLRFAVADAFLPDVGGAFELSVAEGVGRCRRIDGTDVDLTMDTVDLASLYLGGGDAHAMAMADRMAGSEESVRKLNRMFRGDVAPWCEEVF
ncbi:MAG: GNAT family N-acetyltransferase [Actinomycetota bacterium]|nr:GNAT family N-acetyltransferase [Actinomycetota bacterium]